MKFADLFASKRMGVFWSLRLGSEEVSSSDSGGGPGRSGRNLGGEGVWNSSDVDGKERRGGVCARGRGSSSWKGCLVERGGMLLMERRKFEKWLEGEMRPEMQ